MYSCRHIVLLHLLLLLLLLASFRDRSLARYRVEGVGTVECAVNVGRRSSVIHGRREPTDTDTRDLWRKEENSNRDYPLRRVERRRGEDAKRARKAGQVKEEPWVT